MSVLRAGTAEAGIAGPGVTVADEGRVVMIITAARAITAADAYSAVLRCRSVRRNLPFDTVILLDVRRHPSGRLAGAWR
jgi:hypothetical protein